MFKNNLKLNGFILLLIVGMFTSCSKESEEVSAESYGETAAFTTQKSLNSGESGCLEVIFPIEFTLPDGSVVEVSSFEDARAQFVAWKEANPDVSGKPEVVYPIEILTSEGETVSINDRSEIRTLIRDCKGSFGDRPRGGRCNACFELQYPLTITFPDQTTEAFDTKLALKLALRSWRKENPNATERPTLTYPIVIVFEDETTQTINSQEELEAAKIACQEDAN